MRVLTRLQNPREVSRLQRLLQNVAGWILVGMWSAATEGNVLAVKIPLLGCLLTFLSSSTIAVPKRQPDLSLSHSRKKTKLRATC